MLYLFFHLDPGLLYIVGLLSLGRNIGGLLKLLPLNLDIKEGGLNLDFLSVLGRFLHSSIIFELLEVILDPLESVGKVPSLHQLCLVFDPNEELGAEQLVLVLFLLHVLDLHHDVTDPLSSSSPSLHLGESVVVGGDIGHDRLLIGFGHINVLGVKELGDAEMLLSHIKCIFEIAQVVILVQPTKVDQIWTMAVNNGKLKCCHLRVVDWITCELKR